MHFVASCFSPGFQRASAQLVVVPLGQTLAQSKPVAQVLAFHCLLLAGKGFEVRQHVIKLVEDAIDGDC